MLEIVTEFEGIAGFRRNLLLSCVCSSDVNDTKRIHLVKQRLLFYRSENMPESPNIRISFHTLDTNKVCAEVMISISTDAFFKSSFRESLTKTVFGNTNKRSKEAVLTLTQCLESTFKKEQMETRIRGSVRTVRIMFVLSNRCGYGNSQTLLYVEFEREAREFNHISQILRTTLYHSLVSMYI